jgi:predicted dehydrogenase
MRYLDRRRFLNESAVFAAGLAALPTIGSQAPAEEGAANKGGANDRLNVAVIGVRGQGSGDNAGFAGKHNCVVTTICDVDEAVIGKAMTHAEKKQGLAPKYEKDLRRVMDDKSIQVVSIATPNHWHALAAIWAIQAGKDVYLQKPVSHNVLEGRRIIEAARKYGRIVQTGTQSRSMPGMRDAQAFLASGKLGKIHLARGLCYKRRDSIGRCGGPQQPPKTMDFDLWCGPAPNRLPTRNTKANGTVHYDWHWIWDYGNGDLGNQGIHEMDKARWGLGKMELPKSVVSLGGRLGYVDDGETPNTQIIRFDYGDCELVFEVRGLPTTGTYPGKLFAKDAGKKQNYVGNVYYGTEGFLVCPNYQSGVAFTNDGEMLQKWDKADGDAHYGNFIKAVRSRRPEDLHADILEGHLSSALCHLGNISYLSGSDQPLGSKTDALGDSKAANKALAGMLEHLKENKVDFDGTQLRIGRMLTIDSKTERFVDDSKANQMLSREYRKGFEVPERV